MNIKRFINKNGKLISKVILIIILTLGGIKLLNSYYEQEEEAIKLQAIQNENKTDEEVNKVTENNINIYSTETKSIPKAISSFVNYCNNKEIDNAYSMLTEECKDAMFPSAEEFEKLYINNIFNIKRTYELEKWSTDGEKNTYLISLYADILATGQTDNYTQDYYTLIKNEKGVYKLNINSYIYGEDRNLESNVNGIKIKIGKVDVYEEYEKATITITNNTSKKICLTGNKYMENIYLQNSNGVAYSSLNSEFQNKELILEPNASKIYIVDFNKVYSSTNKANYLVLSDVILDYEDYLNSDDKVNYSNRTKIKVLY